MLVDNLPDTAVEHWRLLYQESLADAESVASFKKLDELRLVDRQEMVELLNDYLSNKVSTEKLRATSLLLLK